MKKSLFSLVILLSGNLLKAEKTTECINNSAECMTSSMTSCNSEMNLSTSLTNNCCQEQGADLSDSCNATCDITCNTTCEQTNQISSMTTNKMSPEMVSMQMCMMQAVTNNDMKMVQELLLAGVDVNCCDEKGKTPIMCAVDMGHLEMYQYLMQKGADVFMRDKAGNSVLFYACSKTRSADMEIDHQKISDHQEIILNLLEMGIDF